jgi:hypothetical protein
MMNLRCHFVAHSEGRAEARVKGKLDVLRFAGGLIAELPKATPE